MLNRKMDIFLMTSNTICRGIIEIRTHHKPFLSNYLDIYHIYALINNFCFSNKKYIYITLMDRFRYKTVSLK